MHSHALVGTCMSEFYTHIQQFSVEQGGIEGER